jgi:DNA replication protein DnaC
METNEFERQLEALKSGIVPQEQVAEAQALEMKRRVAELRREARMPLRAQEFCRRKEDRLGAGAWAVALERVWTRLEQPEGSTAVIFGPQGRGKTTAGVLILRRITATGRTGRYETGLGYLMETKDAEKQGRLRATQAAFCEYDTLVLDHVDKLAGADWEMRFLFDLLDRRHNDRLRTVLIANAESAEEVERLLGESVWRRVAESGVVAGFTWPPLTPEVGA